MHAQLHISIYFVWNKRNKGKTAECDNGEQKGKEKRYTNESIDKLACKLRKANDSSVHVEHMYILFVHVLYWNRFFKDVHSSSCRFRVWGISFMMAIDAPNKNKNNNGKNRVSRRKSVSKRMCDCFLLHCLKVDVFTFSYRKKKGFLSFVSWKRNEKENVRKNRM